jgi:16S rRNA (adenine1518-N6/adenine1519-N6)-dimethyltransferase
VGQQARRRGRGDAGRFDPRDRSGQGRDHAAAGRAGQRLLAIEDRSRSRRRSRSAALPNVTVVTSDVLSVDSCRSSTEWLGAAPVRQPDPNRRQSPYNISSPILFALLDLAARTNGVRDAMLMLQKEVADRLVAKVGTGEYGVLTVLTA